MPNTIRQFQNEYRFLSNFWPCEVEFEGNLYPSTEHAYQAAKTLDPMERKRIRLAASPAEAKRLGRRITIRKDWDHVKLNVMRDLCEKKFQIPELRELLLSTGNAILEEGNYWNDTFWGKSLKTGSGQNHLGRILMAIREKARA